MEFPTVFLANQQFITKIFICLPRLFANWKHFKRKINFNHNFSTDNLSVVNELEEEYLPQTNAVKIKYNKGLKMDLCGTPQLSYDAVEN